MYLPQAKISVQEEELRRLQIFKRPGGAERLALSVVWSRQLMRYKI
jgi:hypothetical protein